MIFRNEAHIKKYFKELGLNTIKPQSPYRTGDLRQSIKAIDTSNGAKVVVDIDYAPYTMYPRIHRMWRGKKNPNEDWHKIGVEKFMNKVSKFK